MYEASFLSPSVAAQWRAWRDTITVRRLYLRPALHWAAVVALSWSKYYSTHTWHTDIQKFIYYTHTCYDFFSIEEKTITECILIYTYIHNMVAWHSQDRGSPSQSTAARWRTWMDTITMDWLYPSKPFKPLPCTGEDILYVNAYIHTSTMRQYARALLPSQWLPSVMHG